ncbi:transcriptional regulator with XRE-family HTH domain [Catenuloplanes nepalensis]|uniref:Transcriptional regulator with XRE-family HTH domain n=1 Tax=Catenuloplanes nepalensis TaxID=587533 RepID=A0ABT9N6Q3_9ACTN|nr:hypothetical protein [Catenuloplanes nepalensis]MDP9799378.1 transcriptional regulator with XRE-family HTH domain [Catenuloplanes nepalensis]
MSDDGERTPLGLLLEEAREGLRLSVREAAKRAGMSDARWRQVVRGWQSSRGRRLEVRPRPVTVIGMAKAVRVDDRSALAAAGISLTEEQYEAALDELRVARAPARDRDAELDAVLASADFPSEVRLDLAHAVRSAQDPYDYVLDMAEVDPGHQVRLLRAWRVIKDRMATESSEGQP